MAVSWATKGLQALGEKRIDLVNDDIRIVLVNAGYTPALDTHDFLDDVPSANRLGTAISLTGKDFTDAVFNATSPMTYPATSDVAQGAWIYQHDTATPSLTLDSQRRLLIWIDGRVQVTLAVGVNAGATALVVDPLKGPIPANTTFPINGHNVTTNAPAVEGARTLSLSSGPDIALAAGATGEANTGQAWPIAASPGGLTLNINTGPRKIARITR